MVRLAYAKSRRLSSSGVTTGVTQIVVIGAINADHVLAVGSLPQPGETITCTREIAAHGGKGANQAAAAATLGMDTALIGVVGDDPLGSRERAALEQAGVDTSFIRATDTPTGSATVVVDNDGANMIIVQPGANAELSEDDVRAAMQRMDLSGSVVLASLEVPLDAVAAAAEYARSHGARFVLNPAPAMHLAPYLLRWCDVLLPNAVEQLQLGYSGSELLELGVGAIVITQGADGVEVLRPDRAPMHIESLHVEARDTTGAGDAFCAALCAALRRDMDLERACRFAVIAGALATTGLGARGHLPSWDEVERHLGRAV